MIDDTTPKKRGRGRPPKSKNKKGKKTGAKSSVPEKKMLTPINSSVSSVVITNNKPTNFAVLDQISKLPVLVEFLVPNSKIDQIVPETDPKKKGKKGTDLTIKNIEYRCKTCTKKFLLEKDQKKVNVLEEERIVYINYNIDFIHSGDGNDTLYTCKIDPETDKHLLCAYCSCSLKDNGMKFPVPDPQKSPDGKITTKDFVCGPSCSLTFIVVIIKDEKCTERIRNVYWMVAKMTGKKIGTFKIKYAPDRHCLLCYGGTKTHEEFQEDAFYSNKIINVYPFPIKQTNLSFDEKMINKKNRMLEKMD